MLQKRQVPKRKMEDDGRKVPQKLLSCVLLVHFLYAFSQSVFDAFFAALRTLCRRKGLRKAFRDLMKELINAIFYVGI